MQLKSGSDLLWSPAGTPTIRTHPVVSRAVMGLAVPPLLLGWYVGNYCLVAWTTGRPAFVNTPTKQVVYDAVFAPLEWYQMSRLPGSVGSYVKRDWCYWQGRGRPKLLEKLERDVIWL